MFEYFRSPDGHFGVVDEIARVSAERGGEFLCPTCGARYRLLERLDPTGRPVARK